MDAQDIIKRPIISEKSMGLMAENKYTFMVHPKANKVEIKKAVEEIFKVKVDDVNTISMRGKQRRVGMNFGRTSDWKKAIVKVAEGQRIEFFEGM